MCTPGALDIFREVLLYTTLQGQDRKQQKIHVPKGPGGGHRVPAGTWVAVSKACAGGEEDWCQASVHTDRPAPRGMRI